MKVDPIVLTQELVRCPSVTPVEAGTLTLLQKLLTDLGFQCEWHRFQAPESVPVDNLYATWGQGSPHVLFAGHVDVVPVGDEAAWTQPPFAANIVDGVMYGRGTADMKSGVAAFVAAAAEIIETHKPEQGRISLLITCDEEAVAINGTRPLVDLLVQRGEQFDCCIVGEPSSYAAFGDMIKVGRRGSLTGRMTFYGKQGHTGYPDRADNPLPRALKTLGDLAALHLDDGTTDFQPSNLQLTTVDVGNTASNIIPAKVQAVFNVRFNSTYSGKTLAERLSQVCQHCADKYDLKFECNAEPFITQEGTLTKAADKALEKVAGRRPEHSTKGGTSDARFIAPHCPVIELGLVGQTIHQVDERVPVEEITKLTAVYAEVLKEYFSLGA